MVAATVIATINTPVLAQNATIGNDTAGAGGNATGGNTTSAAMIDVPSLIGLSAIISALVSGGLNYFINIRTFKKQNQIRSIEEKLAAYSYILFHLDRMRFKGEALKKRRRCIRLFGQGKTRNIRRNK